MTPELRDETVRTMRDALREGFDDDATILADAIERVCDAENLKEPAAAELRDAAPALFREVIAEHEREQATWPAVTDCDRLDAAFDDLNEHGVLARHHWLCCQTCGHAAMPEEYDRVVGKGRPARGYAFYHLQDTERAVEGDGLYLAYGAFSNEDGAEASVGRDIVDALRRHGLDPSWDGNVTSRILLPLEWHRRQPPKRWTEGADD